MSKMPWHDRLIELRSKGHTYRECAKVLSSEGYISKEGLGLDGDRLARYASNHGLARKRH